MLTIYFILFYFILIYKVTSDCNSQVNVVE